MVFVELIRIVYKRERAIESVTNNCRIRTAIRNTQAYVKLMDGNDSHKIDASLTFERQLLDLVVLCAIDTRF